MCASFIITRHLSGVAYTSHLSFARIYLKNIPSPYQGSIVFMITSFTLEYMNVIPLATYLKP